MPYCANCGSEVTSKFCTVCGKPLSKKQKQKARDNFREQSPPAAAPPLPHGASPRDDYESRSSIDDYDGDRRPPQQGDYNRDQRPQQDDYDRDRIPERDDYNRDQRPQQDDYDRDRIPERDDYDGDKRSERDDYDRDRRPEQDEYDRDSRSERDDYDRDMGETPERSSYEESTQAPPPPPTQPPVQAPRPKPRPRVGGIIFGFVFLILFLMLLGVVPRPYILFDEDDSTFGKDFSLFGAGGGGGDTGNGIPSDLIGVWRTSGATLTFTSSGTGNLQMDDGFYISFTYRVMDNKKIYFTYSGGTEEEDYSKIITLTSTTLTLQATDVSEGNYMGATTTYTKQ